MVDNVIQDRMEGPGVAKLGEYCDTCQLIGVTFHTAVTLFPNGAFGCHAMIQTLALSLRNKAQTLSSQCSGSLPTSPFIPHCGCLLIGCGFPHRAFRKLVVILIAAKVGELQLRLV